MHEEMENLVISTIFCYGEPKVGNLFTLNTQSNFPTKLKTTKYHGT